MIKIVLFAISFCMILIEFKPSVPCFYLIFLKKKYLWKVPFFFSFLSTGDCIIFICFFRVAFVSFLVSSLFIWEQRDVILNNLFAFLSNPQMSQRFVQPTRTLEEEKKGRKKKSRTMNRCYFHNLYIYTHTYT